MMFRNCACIGNRYRLMFRVSGTLSGTIHRYGESLSKSEAVFVFCSYVPDFIYILKYIHIDTERVKKCVYSYIYARREITGSLKRGRII